MRLLAKLLVQVRTSNPDIKGLITVFHPRYWPLTLNAIIAVCEHDNETNRFDIIYNAETLPMLMRKCIKILKNEFTMQEDYTKLKHLTNFTNVFENAIEFEVAYLANLSRKEVNRHKSAEQLPQSDDILTFENFINMKRNVSLEHFKNGGRDQYHWLNIIQTTAIKILLYNRRRVGEIGKTHLLDYIHAKKANPSDEFFKMLSKDEQSQRLKYLRIDIQGKRADGEGALYISEDNVKCLELIISHRSHFNVDKKNPYLFAIPSPENNRQPRHINICELLSRLSKECSTKYKEIDDDTIRVYTRNVFHPIQR